MWMKGLCMTINIHTHSVVVSFWILASNVHDTVSSPFKQGLLYRCISKGSSHAVRKIIVIKETIFPNEWIHQMAISIYYSCLYCLLGHLQCIWKYLDALLVCKQQCYFYDCSHENNNKVDLMHSEQDCEPMWERLCVFVVWQNESRQTSSHLKPEGYGNNRLPHFIGFCFFLRLHLHSLLSQPLRFALLSRELWFLKGFSMSLIPPSLCVQAKNISARNSRGWQGLCEKKMSFFLTVCEKRKKKTELLLQNN